MAEHVPLVVDDVRVAARDVVRVLHLRVHVDGPDVRAHHVDVVEVRVRPVLQQPRSAGLHPDLGHRHGLARPVDDLRAVERERAHGLRVLAVRAADRADVADVVGAQHRVEGLDAVAEQLDPAVVDVVRRRRSAPGTRGGSWPPCARPRPAVR